MKSIVISIKSSFFVLLVFTLFVTINTGCTSKNSLSVAQPETEGLINPVGLDIQQPVFSWQMVSESANDYQNSYQILVASTRDLLEKNQADLWDSRIVESADNNYIPYEGKSLGYGERAFWKVRVWNSENQPSDWSETAWWVAGPQKESEWEGKWIGLDRAVGSDDSEAENRKLSARYLRKEFEAGETIDYAIAYIAGLGTYELFLNGEKVGDHVLSPALSEYPKRSLYVGYDVSAMIKSGTNTCGIILGNGRYFAPREKEPTPMMTYGFPKVLLNIFIHYTDGSSEILSTDESWKLTANGPIRENNEYDGEFYDARMELSGWKQNAYDDSGWQVAEQVESPSAKLSAQKTEPIRITQTLMPVKITNPSQGVYIFDMGQNMVGWTELKVEAAEGTTIVQRFAETLKENGHLYLANIRGAKVTDTYIAKGEGLESWEPRFVFHGFRYVELTGYPGTPTLSTLTGKVIHDDIPYTGSFTCSDTLLNRIYKNAEWGIRGNYRSIPTDCPQRDERQGWLGDRATGSKGESYIFDIQNLYRKWLTDIFDAQKESGSISDVNPAYWPFYGDNVTWPGTPVILTRMLYQQYGDLQVVKTSYPGLKKWIDYMVDSYMEDSIMPRDTYGDWCVPPVDPTLIHTKDPARLTPGEYLGTAFFYNYLTVMVEFAELLEKDADKEHFTALAEAMKRGFNRNFFNKEDSSYANNSATSGILALAFGLVPEEYEQEIFNKLVHKIEVEHHSHITTGLIGQQYFNRVLTRYGRADLALTVNTQLDYPGYGYMIMNDATTIWELWNGNTADPAMNSGNHVMLLGDFIIWLYEDLAGIRSDITQPGFKHIIMKPVVPEGLDYVKASHNSPYGLITSEWTRSENTFEWDITVPPNTKASVYLPGEKDAKVVGSGAWHFTTEISEN